MAYVGETPWHGLGQRLTAGAGLDAWAEAAGMDYTIKRARVRFARDGRLNAGGMIGAGDLGEMPGQVVLFRSDTGAPLSVVSDRYQVVQPREVLEFFDEVANATGVVLETAGVLFNGARYWALARVPEAEFSVDGDVMRTYIALASACDGSMATNGRQTDVRIVCNNTMRAAGMYAKGADFRCTHRSTFRPVEARKALGLDDLAARMTARREVIETLARVRIGHVKAERIVTQVLTGAPDLDEDRQRRPRGLDRILSLFNGEAKGADLPTARGTAWGLLNAVTQFVDWEGTSRTDDARLASAMWGAGDKLKTQAEALLMEVAEA